MGDFNQNMSFGELTTPNATWIDFFEATLSESGIWVDVVASGGSGAEHAIGIEMTSQGNAIIVGMATVPSLWDPMKSLIQTVSTMETITIFFSPND